ncbi:MAG: hypothetical protein LCH52_05575 [Bacteroidetes bacterium]|nr:hypothetical protein [Bacteroidota bacterium]
MNDEQFQELKDLQQELIDKVSDTNTILMKMIEYQICSLNIDPKLYFEISKDFKKFSSDIGYTPDAGLIEGI